MPDSNSFASNAHSRREDLQSGAEALARGLADAGADIVFANPGTSELHLMSAFDKEGRIRTVLGLFEGVCSGAADGYARIAGRPAICLLHLGPGLGNAYANLHNARRAGTPMVVIVGDHPTAFRRLDPPLASDIEAVAGSLTDAVRVLAEPDGAYEAGLWAMKAACDDGGKLAILIVTADAGWGRCAHADVEAPSDLTRRDADEQALAERAAALLSKGGRVGLYVGGSMLVEENSLRAAHALARRTGAALLCPTFPARLRRGRGVPHPERIAYYSPAAAKQLSDLSALVCLGARRPVPFFAHPERPDTYIAAGCELVEAPYADADTLRKICELVPSPAAAGEGLPPSPAARPSRPSLLAECAKAFAGRLPAEAVVIDEAVTASDGFFRAAADANPHDWLFLTGGAIGQGLPSALGAALASPGRRTVCLQADGSAMYTLQALWSAARERLPLTIVMIANRRYAILRHELEQLALIGPDAPNPDWIRLDSPVIDWAAISRGQGVPAEVVCDAAGFEEALIGALEADGPRMIVIDAAG